MKFVLATHNPNKIREMGAILGQFGVEVVSPKELGITVDVEETGSTFAENAMLKAKAICAAIGQARQFAKADVLATMAQGIEKLPDIED